MTHSTSAYIDPQLQVPGLAGGVLSGRTVAIKDLFDVAGHRTGFGHPTWLATHPPATETAPAVQRLLDAGCTVQGRTHMDELAYSLNGENYHYGTPANPAAPGRIPGGSSSGSAVAVAAGDVDIGLGSDTGGSVRVPASYCGVFGIRPTHGRVSLAGARPLAPSFDTVGWFTRSLDLMAEVAVVLLEPTPAAGNPPAASQPPAQWLIPTDAWDLAQPATAQSLKAAVLSRASKVSEAGSQQQLDPGLLVEALEGRSPKGHVQLAGGPALEELGVDQLTAWPDVFRVCQAWEIWQEHGAWIREHNPTFGPGIKERFAMASGITAQEVAVAQGKREAITAHLLDMLGQDGILVMPTAPGPAPLLDTPPAQLDAWRRSLLSMTSIAGLAGLPQVNLPVATVDGLPVGLSLVGPPGADERLLRMAKACTGLA